ncbi:MAG: tetratricopeptide repeat protein [Rubripirellula sp.]
MMVTSTTKRREMIHWFWLWMLAGIAISVISGRTAGQESLPLLPPPELPQSVMPMPNVDHPEWFHYPEEEVSPNEVSLNDVLRFNESGEHKQAVIAWRHLQTLPHSETWKQVGLGVAYLRLEKSDQAVECLTLAIELDPTNAVAEYFLGRADQQQGRDVPFWYERDQHSPFRLASHRSDRREDVAPRQQPDRSFLPHFRNDKFDLKAREHFRRAVELAKKCNLDAIIDVVPSRQPRIQLTSQGADTPGITVRQLLASFHEVDFVEKAQREIDVRVAAPATAGEATAGESSTSVVGW